MKQLYYRQYRITGLAGLVESRFLLKGFSEQVVLSIEISTIQANINFEREFECKLEDFLDMSYAAGADLSRTNIQDHMRTLERNKNMLKIVETALEILKNRHIKGVKYYWILFYTYLSEKPCESTEVIIDCVNDKIDDYICWTAYFRLRKKAIETLGDILWGFTSKECLPVLNEFIDYFALLHCRGAERNGTLTHN